jgi:recombination protein RecT
MTEELQNTQDLDTRRANAFVATLAANVKKIEAVLPKGTSVQRVCRTAAMCLANNPVLMNTTPDSFLLAVLGACALDLELLGPLGQAYLVPYGKTCQLIPGYRGLIKIATRAGRVRTVEAVAVQEADFFEYEFGLHPRLIHRPRIASDSMPDEKSVTHVYAVFTLGTGEKQFVVMSRAEINAIRDKSQGYRRAIENKKPHPWIDHWSEMAKKTVIRRGFKLIPPGDDRLDHALAIEDAADEGRRQPITIIPELENVPESPSDVDVQEGGAK